MLARSLDTAHTRVYFKDCLIKHSDGSFIPVVRLDKGIREVVFECDTCLEINRYPVDRDTVIGNSLSGDGVVKAMFVTDMVTSRDQFQWKMVYNMKTIKGEPEGVAEQGLSELMAAVRVAEEVGIHIGRRGSRGFGKVSLRWSVKPITLADIENRAKQLAQIIGDEDGKFNVHLISDTLSPFPLSGDVIVRDAKNAAKFFLPDYVAYKDPKIQGTGKPIQLVRSVTFLDLKTTSEKPGFRKEAAISRGTKFTYILTGGSHEFFMGLAAAEMLRGLGDRTSFGKGEFRVN